jgi:predicted negative regulator of RcsB-dependent stress response
MANQLDLEEQEQLDQIKHFWSQYGNAITWALIIVLAAFASWNFYNYWQRNQAAQAAALFDEVERSVQLGDMAKIDRVFADMQERYSSTAYAQQSGLLVAKRQVDAGNLEAAKTTLTWVVEKSSDLGYQAIAKLRLADVLMQTKNFDGALSQLNGTFPTSFGALIADRKGDVLMLQGKKTQAATEYEKAYQSFDMRTEYRRLVEVKLNSLGVDAQARDQAAKVNGK